MNVHWDSLARGAKNVSYIELHLHRTVLYMKHPIAHAVSHKMCACMHVPLQVRTMALNLRLGKVLSQIILVEDGKLSENNASLASC